MKVSPELIKLLKHHEGVRLRPYQCPAMLWSIAIGHVIDPSHIAVKYADRKNLPIPPGWDRQLSMGEVDAILAQDLSRFERGVARLCPGSVNHQGQFDALVSLSFNIGLGNTQRSSVRMLYNRGDIAGAADAFLMWTKAAGRVRPGLVKRRQDERALFLSQLG